MRGSSRDGSRHGTPDELLVDGRERRARNGTSSERSMMEQVLKRADSIRGITESDVAGW